MPKNRDWSLSDKKIYRDCESKTRYKDEYHANKVLKNCEYKGHKGTSDLHVYFCDLCGGFHLGHDKFKRRPHDHHIEQIKSRDISKLNSKRSRDRNEPGFIARHVKEVVKNYDSYPEELKTLYDEAMKKLLTPKEE